MTNGEHVLLAYAALLGVVLAFIPPFAGEYALSFIVGAISIIVAIVIREEVLSS